MNKLTVTATAALAACVLAAAPVFAHGDDGWRSQGHWDYARVVRAEPIYRDVRVSAPREVCREEPVTERRVYSAGPDPGAILLGAAIGGVIGHQFGHGHGRDVSTAVGAMIGAGHGAAASAYGNSRVVERDTVRTYCRDEERVSYERDIDGYDVTYRYHGELYHTRLPYDPGSRVRVRVDVSPEYGDDLN